MSDLRRFGDEGPPIPTGTGGGRGYHVLTVVLGVAVFVGVVGARIAWRQHSMRRTVAGLFAPPENTPTNVVQLTVDPADRWGAYLNIYDDRANPYRPRGFVVDPKEVNAGFEGDTAFMGPVRSHPANRPSTDTNWWGSNGWGTKRMQSFLHVTDDGLSGKVVVFSGHCLSNDLPRVPGYEASAIVSDFSADNSDEVAAKIPLRAGQDFRVSLRTRPGGHVRYGFELLGPNLDPARFGRTGRIWMTGRATAEAPPEPVMAHFENPSFEFSRFRNPPGYAVDNGGSIPGWRLSNPESIGVDAQGGWFANNGTVPNGRQVAFIRTRDGGAETLSTTITGLEPRSAYQVGFRANARKGGARTRTAWSLNGGDFVPFKSWPPVDGDKPFHMNHGGFVATGTNATLVIRSQSGTDSALLVDDFFVCFVPGIARDMSLRKGAEPALPTEAEMELP